MQFISKIFLPFEPYHVKVYEGLQCFEFSLCFKYLPLFGHCHLQTLKRFPTTMRGAQLF